MEQPNDHVKDPCHHKSRSIILATPIRLSSRRHPRVKHPTFEEAARSGAKLAFLLSGPNAFAAALLTREHRAVSLAEAVGSGKIRGILAFEADMPEELLSGISLLAVADRFPSEAMKKMRVFLPTTAWVEMDGTFINNEGRAQRFRKVMNPGLPIKGLDPALHPPRVHRRMPLAESPVRPGALLPTWRSGWERSKSWNPFSDAGRFCGTLTRKVRGSGFCSRAALSLPSRATV